MIQEGAVASCLLAEEAHEVTQKMLVWGPHGRGSCEDSLLKEQLQVQTPRSELGVEYLAVVEPPLSVFSGLLLQEASVRMSARTLDLMRMRNPYLL